MSTGGGAVTGSGGAPGAVAAGPPELSGSPELARPPGLPELPEPAGLTGAVDALFGARAPLARRYAALLATSGVERGLLGPREAERVWERHVLNCAVVAPLLPPDARVVDVGSGAGLPGLCWALARPDAEVVLLEPLERRASWLREVVAQLDLPVEVVRARAEEVRAGPAALPPAAVVTARAVAPLEVLAGWCLPLLAPGGQLLALKGATARAELEAAVPALRRMGASSWEVLTAGAGLVAVPTTVVGVTVGAGRRGGADAPGRGRAGRRRGSV